MAMKELSEYTHVRKIDPVVSQALETSKHYCTPVPAKIFAIPIMKEMATGVQGL